MLDYVTLKFIWWLIFGFLIVAYSVTGGMDVGVNFLLPVVGKTDEERRLVLNSTGPTWEGNQVWLITLGAGMFAIWPIAYGTIFSSMYLAFILVLLVLILRPPGLDYRSKINSASWRNTWDSALFISGFVLALAFGFVTGNLFTGLPFQFDQEMREIYEGSFLSMVSPCSLLFAIVNLCMMGTQGALFLQYKLPGELEQRAKKIAALLSVGFVISGFLACLYVCLVLPGYRVVDIPDLNTNFVVTNKVVTAVAFGWMQNFINQPLLLIFPAATILTLLLAIYLSQTNRAARALFVHSGTIIFAATTVGVALFPFIMPSSVRPDHSLTIWDVASTQLTLMWALVMTILFVPIILMYTTWVYKVVRGKVSLQPESY